MFILTLLFVGGCYYGWQRYEFSRVYNFSDEGDYEEVIRLTDRLISFSHKKKWARELRAFALAEVLPEEAVEEMRDLLETGELEYPTSIRLRLAELLLEMNEIEEVKLHLAQLSQSEGINPRYLIMLARVNFAEKKYSDAYEVLRELLLVAPNHPQGNLVYAAFLLNSNDPMNAVLAKVSLRKAGRAQDEYGLQALTLLATHPGLPLFSDDRLWLAQRLREHPNSSAYSRLLASTQELVLNSDQAETIVERTVATEGSSNPELMASWLLRIGQSARAIDFVTSGAGTELPIGISEQVKVRALLMQNDYESVKELLQQEDSQIPEAQRESLLALADTVLTPASQNTPSEHWLRAYALGREQSNTDSVYTLARLALRNRWLNEAREAYEWTLENTADPMQSWRMLSELFVVYQLKDATPKMLETARRMLQLNPDEATTQNNLYYLETLLGEEPKDNLERIAALAERFPGEIFSSGYAFALWKTGEFERAAEALSKMDERYMKVPACALVGALIAYDNTDPTRARNLVSTIQPSSLLPEELALYQKLSTKLEN
ncbi:MAG: hypothetical protein ACPGSB_06225 [Opitutales bacterium]